MCLGAGGWLFPLALREGCSASGYELWFGKSGCQSLCCGLCAWALVPCCPTSIPVPHPKLFLSGAEQEHQGVEVAEGLLGMGLFSFYLKLSPHQKKNVFPVIPRNSQNAAAFLSTEKETVKEQVSIYCNLINIVSFCTSEKFSLCC